MCVTLTVPGPMSKPPMEKNDLHLLGREREREAEVPQGRGVVSKNLSWRGSEIEGDGATSEPRFPVLSA